MNNENIDKIVDLYKKGFSKNQIKDIVSVFDEELPIAKKQKNNYKKTGRPTFKNSKKKLIEEIGTTKLGEFTATEVAKEANSTMDYVHQIFRKLIMKGKLHRRAKEDGEFLYRNYEY